MNRLKKILALLMALFILSGCFAVLAEGEDLVNVASQAKLDSSGYSYQMTVWSLIDGDIKTGWSSNTANNTWFTMDLGRKMMIERIELVTRQDVDQAHTRNNFVVEVSNSSTFSNSVVVGQVGSTSLAHKATFKAEVGGKYRYVRYRKTAGNYSFLTEARVLVKEENMPTDGTEKNEIFNRINLFETLGVDLETLSENVTREEAAVVFSKLMKLSGSEKDYYKDIKNPEILAAANALCEAGVLSEAADGKFNPLRPLTYHQAVKMAVAALGCSIRAEYKGSFPSGYVICAQELGILNGVSASEFNRESFINLLYNMLEANIYDISDISNDDVSYSLSNEIFAERFFDIKKVTGIVEENYAFTLYLGKSDIEKNQLFIEGKKYNFEPEEYTDLFGKSVHCYYKEEISGKRDVVFMYADTDQSKLTLSLADYEKISGTTLEYDEKRYKLDSEYKIIKNGMRISPSVLGTLSDDGIIELYDNDGDTSYEIVNIIETTTKIVESYNESDDKTVIYFKDKSRVSVSNNDKVFIKYDNGDYGELNSFKKNDIVSYFQNTGIFLAYVGNKCYENKITEITDKKVVIDHKDAYTLAKNAVDITAKILNKYGSIYFDYMGNIFWYDSTVSDGNGYGYLVGYGEANGFDDAKVRIFTEKGSFTVYTISVPMTIDGAYNSTAAATSKIKTLWDSKPAEDVGILIKYTAKTDMSLSTLDTVAGGNTGDENCLTKLYTPTESKYYSYGVHDERFLVDKDAVIFRIPKSVNDEKDFSIIRGSQLSDKGSYKLHGYTHDTTTALPTIHAGIIDSSKPGFGEKPQMFVISQVSTTYLDGETVPLLTGYSEGQIKKYTMDNEFIKKYGNELSKGDVLQVRVDANNVILNSRYIYNNGPENAVRDAGTIVTDSGDRILNFSDKYNATIGGGGILNAGTSVYNTPLYASMGVYAQEGEYLHIRKMKKDIDTGELVFEDHEGYEANKDYILNSSMSVVYFVDKRNDTVKIGSTNDIVSYKEDPAAFSKVVARVHSGETLEIVVYN